MSDYEIDALAAAYLVLDRLRSEADHGVVVAAADLILAVLDRYFPPGPDELMPA